MNDYELVELAREDESASEQLYTKYRPLIISIAKKYAENSDLNGIDLSDLIQEGMIGFNDAINHFDQDKDAMFYTYAKMCIERQIMSALKIGSRKKNSVLNTSVSLDSVNDDDLSLNQIISNTDSPEEIIMTEENIKEINKRLNEDLTDLEAAVYSLKRSGFNYVEIADILGKSKKKIDNTLQRIRTKFLKAVDDTHAN